MAKEIDKIIQSKTAPKSNNVLWDDGENLKINRNGKWENANNTETNSLSIDPVVWKYICNPYLIGNDIIVDNSYLEAIRVAIENNAFACVKVIYDNKICQVISINEQSNSHWEMLIHTGSIEINVSAKIIPEDTDYVWDVSAV